MSLSFQIPWHVFLIAAASGVAASFYTYRNTVPPVPPFKRYLLSTLRGLALTLMIFVLCEPLFTLTRRSTLQPAVAVLVDNSLSMSITDGAGNREQLLRSMISGQTLNRLSSAAHVELYTFSPSLHGIDKDSLRVDGMTTDIASALRSLKNKSLPQLKAILLLSDGNYNAGENPLDEAGKIAIPIFCAGIGDSLEQKDIVVEKLLTNSITYIQSTVPIDATIKVSGFENRKLPVNLLEDGKQIDQRFVTLPPSASSSTAEYSIHFTFTPTATGVKKYTVSVPAERGEVTKKNNAKSVYVKILKNKMRVAVIAGAPSADVSAIMQSLHADPNIESSLAVQQPSGQFANQPLSQFAGLASAECIVLIGFPTETTSPFATQLISKAVTARRLPLLFIISRTLDIHRFGELASILPFTTSTDRIDEQLVFPNIPAQQQYDVLVQSTENSSFDWNKLPPIFSSLATFKAKPEALVLVTTKVQGVAIDNPLIVARSIMQMKSIAVLGYGIWRWKLLAGASPETENFFDPWISNAVRWLVTRDDNKQLRIEPSKEIFSQGEAVDFLGEAYNANYEPLDDADIHVEATALSSQQHFETILRPIENGQYEGQIEALPEGEYSFTATAKADGTDLGKSGGRFSVGEQSIEFSDTKLNKALLEQLAAVSGGEYADGTQFDKLIHDLVSRPSMKPGEETTASEFELWNLPSLLSVIVALLGFEWFLRKRSGML
ncbi:MAG: vWA domain-containing protein [Bacteroidota bacterium]